MQLLKDLIIEEIKKEGKITFDEFMQMALYHPKYGYYNSDKERVGMFGDYYTSPTVHRIFGELIAKQIEEMWRTMGKAPFTVVEMGANKGWLCYDIVQCVMKEYPEFYDNFHYIIVETNPYAREKQGLLLNSLGKEKGKVSWHTHTNDGFSFKNIQGCFLSNEFFDAQPIHRLRLKNGILKEIYVGYNGKSFNEIEDGVSTYDLKKDIDAYMEYPGEARECEVNLDAAKWVKMFSDSLSRGFVITIDYGDIRDRLYQRSINGGTLRCYYKHTVNRDYYERVGEQDITAHVDFTNLMNAGRRVGLEVTGFTRQSHYLIALGILDRLSETQKEVETILKIKNLFHPEGMGDVFKVLIQHKNVENPHLNSLRSFHL